ncbi:MAG TPA: DNA-3-methyladenine glycosylase [Bacillus sp. (in: firmicutes)]|uniref:DNA-3-methyladenine glycosylase family protein n=1 Tax=Bacillus litorisediminis TaxID=2922713 RepID=UPI001FAE1891|nr:DNA-3-methyladenine glycosylase [Bacillus litorisediminis]HWO77317.1 DNA-3-methyladenine glycosylase [Bacillus sp. (in: firmicutes)]
MKWKRHESYLEILPPKEFDFKECLVFLGRSSQEVLHQIKAGSVYKLLKIKDETILLKISGSSPSILIEFPIQFPSSNTYEEIAEYIWEWFDFDQDLNGFYQAASKDEMLQSLIAKYKGLRVIGIPDLFEALTWAIIGQQINLGFAYTLKKRFVEQFGESLTFEGDTYWLYPSYEKIAQIRVEELRGLQFTRRKAEYIIGVARAMANGKLTKASLLQQKEYQPIKKSLMAIRGVGAWTADYVMMKCLQIPDAFPIADAGLHQALKLQLGLKQKPAIEEINVIAANWENWRAYATFYLWRSLYESNK